MVQPKFGNLPVSYRLSQNAMLAAIGAILFSRHLAAIQLPIAAKSGIAGVVGCVVLFALVCLRGDRGVGCPTFVERKLMGLDAFEHFDFQVLPDGGRTGIRNATGEDIRDVLRFGLDPGGQNPATTDADWPAAVITRVWDPHLRKSQRIRAQGKEGG